MITNRNIPEPPGALSPQSAAIWRDLLEANDFSPHEGPMLEKSLKFFDLSERLLREADEAPAGTREKILKLAFDANSSALRCWRLLKFVDPAKPARRPGRPSDIAWSARTAQAEQERLRRANLSKSQRKADVALSTCDAVTQAEAAKAVGVRAPAGRG